MCGLSRKRFALLNAGGFLDSAVAASFEIFLPRFVDQDRVGEVFTVLFDGD